MNHSITLIYKQNKSFTKTFQRTAVIVLMFALSPINIGHSKSLKVYKHVDENGIIHYSSKKPNARNVKVLRIKCPECKWKSTYNWNSAPLYKDKYLSLIQSAAKKWDLDSELIQAVIHAESSFIADNVSSAGAQGLMQLMPETQKHYAVNQPYDPEQNINGGSAYLSHLMKRYNNNLDLALAAYNAGETAVAKYGNSIPPYEETRNYVKRVNTLLKRYRLNK